MKILRAVHQIVRGSGRREIVNPNDIFQAEGDEAEFLLRVGAAVPSSQAPAAPKPPTPTVQKQVEEKLDDDATDDADGDSTDEPADDEPADDEPAAGKDLAEMTVKELLAEADARGIDVPKTITKKADIIAYIEGAEEDII